MQHASRVDCPHGNTRQHPSQGAAIGAACGIGAGALWDLVFLAPELVREFNPLQLTLFALLYGLLWGRRLPTPSEITAFACMVASVSTCLAAHRRPATVEPAA